MCQPRYRRHKPVELLFKPNLWLQKLTTRVPDDTMIEVAIASFQQVVEAEGLTVDENGRVVATPTPAVQPSPG